MEACTECVAVATSTRTLITGAASGIGRSFAQAMAARGEDLLLLDRTEDGLRELAATLAEAHSVQVDLLVIDLADEDMQLQILRYLHSNHLRISRLINCAGVGTRSPFVSHVRRSIDQLIDVNIRAVVELTRLLLPGMLRRGQGMVVNVCSIAAFEKMPDWAVYGATKAFVQSFTESLQEELAGSGVYVASVCPGPTCTPFYSGAGLGDDEIPDDAQTPDEVVAEAMDGIDSRRRLIVTGSSNRIRIMMQRLSVRSVVQSVLRYMRRLKPSA